MNTQLNIDADFTGGNILFDRIEGDTVHVKQDLRDTEGHWFYWQFRVRGAAGRRLRFEFNDDRVIGVHGPACSTDGGLNWRWLGAACADKTGFTHQFAADEDDVRLGMCVPYVQRDLNRWLARHANDERLGCETLCVSGGGAAVPLLRIKPSGEPRYGVLLTCRHHCCEAMASFALEGLLDAMLGDDELGRWYAENVMTAAAAMMDYDGVEAGDQGKNRKPHDHNRDYGEEPIYAEVRAVQELVRGWSDGVLRLGLDLHCPWLRGVETNQVVYLVGSRDEAMWGRQSRFGAILEKVRTGPIVYQAKDNLPFGKAWNVATNFGGYMSNGRWVGEQIGEGMAATIEIPYADVKGRAISADDARSLGRDLAKAIREYLVSD